ncbi:hypothetical protein JYU03_00135 [bacterium AH-315-F03]|nr:hypothetical protein [bacterium AH-315-F03]
MNITTTITALLTLAIFSFLYKDNPVYKFVERLLVGLAVGYSLVLLGFQALYPLVLKPVMDGSSYISLLPFAGGMLLFARFSSRWRWLTALPLAAMIAAGVGTYGPLRLRAYAINQMTGIVNKVQGSGGVEMYLFALVSLVGFVATLSYFYFGRKGSGQLVNASAKLGTYFLMVFFGATIGYTVMSRMTILIGRLDFLFRDWLGLVG